ncbi:hypothetical protein BVI434_1010004 [Burkholderia vietnamiensis]|nr:hypothetical protein BVI434_1010004 [Burkholderia vietnamiensis]
MLAWAERQRRAQERDFDARVDRIGQVQQIGFVAADAVQQQQAARRAADGRAQPVVEARFGVGGQLGNVGHRVGPVAKRSDSLCRAAGSVNRRMVIDPFPTGMNAVRHRGRRCVARIESAAGKMPRKARPAASRPRRFAGVLPESTPFQAPDYE